MADNAMMFMLVVSLFLLISVAFTATDPGDLAILNEFKKGMQNPKLLNWPANDDDPCGPPSWKYVFCAGSRVTQIQSKNLGLVGNLPKDFNKLSKLSNLGLQNNNLTGPLPSFSGLSDLRYAYLDNNNFTSIPADFFHGLDSLETMAIDYNPLNATTGWSLPNSLENSAQLTELSLMSCNLVGPLPDFLGGMPSLTQLRLSINRISGGIPASFNGSNLQVLWLNEQGTESSDGDGDGGGGGVGMTGPIDVIATMTSLTSLWLHGNQFNGTIPKNIGDLASLTDLNVNTNDLVGLIPESLAGMDLVNLDLSNNHFMGPIPHFKVKNASYSHNQFCQSTPGTPCAPQVMALLDFLDAVSYPLKLVDSWSGNEPCGGGQEWLGLACNSNQEVIVINLPGYRLNGTLSPSVAKLDALTKVLLRNNNISGPVPSNWTSLKYLEMLDLSGNNISPPLPKFRTGVTVQTDNNPLFAIDGSSTPPTSVNGGTGSSTPGSSSSTPSPGGAPETGDHSSSSKLAVIVAPLASFAGLMLLLVPLTLYFYCKRREPVCQSPSSLVIQPRDPSDPDDTVKVVVANNTNWGTSVGSGSASRNSSGMGESHVIDAGNLVISVQILRKVTKHFAPENELGRGGFGVVYKGEFDDGTQIAVKRMEAGIITIKAVNEFQSEIAVLSKVRHRHLVSLLGYSIEGNERLLVYEYMPQGALSKHLFHWKSLKLEPLSWKRRLNIALDVARGMEYLHNLCHHSFIHRDLKSSNILLGDDFRAKVADFGLVKAAPDGNNKSVVTRLAGTFGYLAPEYAVTGKITTKADVFSFGVVLMELLTGLMALDEDRPEEKQYLAAWFWRIKSDKETLLAGIDPALDVKDETIESIVAITELAGHCTAREPSQRPDMGHAVNILSQLVEKWKPLDDETEEYAGIDYNLPLTQMVKGWQEAEGKDLSYMDLEDSKGSIPARPTGFAESFTSVDGR